MSDERAINVIDQTIGQRVRARRLELGMSQERLAEMLGVTFQQVQKYEKGVNRIAASRLLNIAAALELPPARFLECTSNSGSGRLSQQIILSTYEGAQLAGLFATIKSVKVRRRILKLVRALAEPG